MNNTHNCNIRNLLNKRKSYLDDYYDSYDENTNEYTVEYPEIIDELSQDIITYIRKNINNLDIDNILETLTHLGYAPNLIYDDNGHFAITDDAFQNVTYGDEPSDLDISLHINKERFEKTIKLALINYLKSF